MCEHTPHFPLRSGDPHPGNIFALRDGRIAYVDFGNVAQLSQRNKAVLVDAVVHAVNEDYRAMAADFVSLGFLTAGEQIATSLGRSVRPCICRVSLLVPLQQKGSEMAI